KSFKRLLPSGDLKAGDRDYNVFSNTQFGEARPLGSVVVRPGTTQGGVAGPPVRLSDVATIEDSSADQQEIVRLNGERGVYIRVLKQPGANTVEVVDAVRAPLPTLPAVPDTAKLAIPLDEPHY